MARGGVRTAVKRTSFHKGKEYLIQNILKIFNWKSLTLLRVVLQEDRRIVNTGGDQAVQFYLELLKKIEKAEKENNDNRKDDLLKTPTNFFL